MPRKAPRHAATFSVWAGPYGYQFTGRNEEGRVIYDSPGFYTHRLKARRAAEKLWPKARYVP